MRAQACALVLQRPVIEIPPGRTMALKAEGAALDCFEVTLKCEEGEDEEEAMVVAVIPRPEPMLRGEDGRGPHFRVTVSGSLPRPRQRPRHPLPTLSLVPRAPLPLTVWARACSCSAPTRVWNLRPP